MKKALLLLAALSAVLVSGCYTKTVFVPVNGRNQMDRSYTVDLYGNRIHPTGLPPAPGL